MTSFKKKYNKKSLRLPNRDYRANGWYFVTICTRDRHHFFGNIIRGKMQLSNIGKIAKQFWLEIPQHSQYTYIDEYVIMPNHVHGIIVIDRPNNYYSKKVEMYQGKSLKDRWETEGYNLPREMSKLAPKANSLSVIIRSYKSSVTRWCKQNGYNNFAWQSRFYEHIIRKDGSINRIRHYIINNPLKWEFDANNK